MDCGNHLFGAKGQNLCGEFENAVTVGANHYAAVLVENFVAHKTKDRLAGVSVVLAFEDNRSIFCINFYAESV